MKALKTIQLISWAAAIFAGFVFLAVSIGWLRSGTSVQQTSSEQLSPMLSAGGEFRAIDHHGKSFTQENILGKPTLMFFGFTYCPNICPTTLSDLTNLMEKLGKDAEKLNVIFISVDPVRDTTKMMADYLSAFDKRIIGLTLTPRGLEEMAKKYHFYYKKVPTDGGDYTMDHTAGVYMFEADGALRGIIDLHEPEVTKRAKINKLITY